MILLVVDTQKGITDERLFAFEKVEKNIRLLIETARSSHVEVVFVQHDDGPGTGFSKGDEAYEIYDKFAPEVSEKVFCKSVNSSFHSSVGLLQYLREKGENQVMIVGLQTDYCIDATIKSGFEHGFEMIVPAYTNSTFDNKYFSKEAAYHYYNELMWHERYAKCVSIEDAIRLMQSCNS